MSSTIRSQPAPATILARPGVANSMTKVPSTSSPRASLSLTTLSDTGFPPWPQASPPCGAKIFSARSCPRRRLGKLLLTFASYPGSMVHEILGIRPPAKKLVRQSPTVAWTREMNHGRRRVDLRLAVVTTKVGQAEPAFCGIASCWRSVPGGRGRSRLQPAEPAAALALTGRDPTRRACSARRQYRTRACQGMTNVQSNDSWRTAAGTCRRSRVEGPVRGRNGGRRGRAGGPAAPVTRHGAAPFDVASPGTRG